MTDREYLTFGLAVVMVALMVVTLRRSAGLRRRLVQVEEREKALGRYSSDAIFELDSDGRCIEASPQVSNLLGLAAGEVIGRRLHELADPADSERMKWDFMSPPREDGAFGPFEYLWRNRQGSAVTVRLSGAGRGGLPPGHRRFLARDVTRERQLDRNIRETTDRFQRRLKAVDNEAKAAVAKLTAEADAFRAGSQETGAALNAIRTILDRLPAAVVATDAADRIVMVGGEAERFAGCATGELLGRSFWERFSLPDETEKGKRARADRRTVEEGGGYVMTTVARDGHRRLMNWQWSAPGEDGSRVAAALDLTGRLRAEKLTRTSLQEKETLLKEIHHRVKNNLQIISSLVRLQSRLTADAGHAEVFRDISSRIQSMALVHERLYQSDDMANIDLALYVRNLTHGLFRSYGINADRVRLSQMIDPGIRLGVDTIIPLGLMLNELVTNSLKHAFPDERRGQIEIAIGREPDGFLTVGLTDNGVGLPAGYDPHAGTSLGMQLITSLAEQQLRGSLECASEVGRTTFRIRFREIGHRTEADT